jgi:hypothetical protein
MRTDPLSYLPNQPLGRSPNLKLKITACKHQEFLNPRSTCYPVHSCGEMV